MNGATVLTKFIGDTKDLDKKTKEAKDGLSGLQKAFIAGGAGALVLGGVYKKGMETVIDMTSKAVQSAGQLEQQIGGTEAVFGEFADTVQKTASESFNKMGTSANEYMQTINKMASILQGSGYTIEDSMKTSSQVMQRAADVASVMGITTEEAMNAVTAAAKGNFTMMDNLGVAMNATNLQAYALSKGIQKSYTEMSTAEKSGLAYQMFLEKTSKYAGNYEKENKTLAGSMQSLTSAWKNFLSGAGGTQEVIDSVINALDVITPMVVEIAPKIVTGIVQIINALLPMLPDLISQLLPAVIEGTNLLIQGLIQALPQIVSSLAQMIPTLIPMIIEAVLGIIPALLSIIPDLIKSGAELIGGLIGGMVQMIPILWNKAKEIVLGVFNIFKGMSLKDIGIALIKGLWNGLGSMKDWVISKVKDLGKSILKGLKGILGIKSPSKEFALIGKFSVLGYTEALDDMSKDVEKQVGETFGISPQLANSSALNYSPSVQVVNNISMKQDPLGQMVNDIKTFSGGSKNDYNYGMGV